MSDLDPADRARRLGLLHESTSFEDIDDAVIARVRQRLRSAVRTGPRSDLQALTVVEQVLSGQRTTIPGHIATRLAAALGVTSGYFADAALAERDEAALLPTLLAASGVEVDGAALCRVQPDRQVRTSLCLRLLEVARNHRVD